MGIKGGLHHQGRGIDGLSSFIRMGIKGGLHQYLDFDADEEVLFGWE
jgi:hypothetical protein